MGQYKSSDAWDPTMATSDPQSFAASGPSAAGDGPNELGDLPAGGRGRSGLPAPRPPRLPWVLLGVGAAAAAAFGALVYRPQVRAASEAASALAVARADNEKLEAKVDELDRRRVELEASAAALQSTVQEKEAALDELTRTQEELAEKLQAEIEKGDVLIKQRQGELVVDLVDQILFDSGAAELNDQGKAAIRKVGETFLKIPDKVIQVGGHTDNVPISPKLVDKFPSNWELSTARATNVVRFLQDEVKVPGQRLVAAGFSEFRPAASNRNNAGRRKNRRIEVVLLPLQPAATHVAGKR